MRILTKLNKIKIMDILDIFKFILAYPIALILKKKYQNVWLISERCNEARDNGYHLFKYVRTNYPYKNVYYVIENNCEDYYKIRELGNIIKYRSFKHYIYYIMADVWISAHTDGGMPNMMACFVLEKLKIIKHRKVFLQHGITKDYIDWLLYKYTKYDVFVCGAKPEYEYIKECYGYPENNVQYLGFCRFDNLHNYIKKKQILVMPTHRTYLSYSTKKISEVEKINKFKSSDYFKNYMNLINDKKLHNLLKKTNTQMLFYLHPNMQGYSRLFNSNSECIKIIADNEHDIQELLKESSMLITDYSSVFMDFAYMKKPLIYFQFDINKYRECHYKNGYFQYEVDGFGPVCKDINTVINNIKMYIDNNFEVDKKYLKKIEDFFSIYDNENCKRTFDFIQKYIIKY